MSSIRYSLEKLDHAVEKLDQSLAQMERAPQNNVVDVDFVAQRLDKAIATVESLLEEEE